MTHKSAEGKKSLFLSSDFYLFILCYSVFKSFSYHSIILLFYNFFCVLLILIFS
jgi:hypothetical protein